MRRYDAAPLSKVVKTGNGYKVEGALTRTGIFTYRNADGTERKEYRPPEEVFSATHLDSFKGSPVTVGHPGLLTPENWKEHAVGHIGDDVRQDGNFAVGTIYVQDAKACALIEKGKLKELSCGYDVDLDETPGALATGERFDAVQRNLRGNHVAMGPSGWGRAGGDVAMRLDSVGDEIRLDGRKFKITHERKGLSHVYVEADDEEGNTSMQYAGSVEHGKLNSFTAPAKMSDKESKQAEKLHNAAQGGDKFSRDENGRFDSISAYTEEDMADKTEVEQPTKIKARDIEIRVDGQAEIDRLTAKCEMLQGQNETLTAQLADTSRVDSQVAERVSLIDTAKSVIKDFKADGKTNREIKIEVSLAKNPKMKFDSKSSEDFVQAAFNMALTFETPVETHASLGQARVDASNATVVTNSIKDADERNKAASRDAWKTPSGSAK